MPVLKLFAASVVFLGLAQIVSSQERVAGQVRVIGQNGVVLPVSPSDQPLPSSLPPEKLVGTVLLPNGEPAANAPVLLAFLEVYGDVHTDAQGKFELLVETERLVAKLGKQEWRRVSVSSYLKGFGIGFVVLRDVDPYQPLTIQLVEDVTIQGRILDQQGRPVAVAEIVCLNINDAKGNLDGFLTAYRDSPTRIHSYRQLSMRAVSPLVQAALLGGKETELFRVATDAQGKFTISGIGCERTLDVLVKHPQIETQSIVVATRNQLDARWKLGPPNAETKEDLEIGMSIPLVYGAEFRHLASPGMSVRGTLTSADNGEVVKGMRVNAHMRSGATASGKSGVDGKFELSGLGLEGELTVSALNPGELPWLDGTLKLRVNSGSKSEGTILENMDLRLDRGVVVSGQVVDEDGNPVSGHVGYLSWPGNPELKKLASGFRSNNTMATSADGKYRIVVPHGVGVLYFRARDESFFSPATSDDFGIPIPKNGVFMSANRGGVFPEHFSVLKRIDPAADVSQVNVDLTVSLGTQVRGNLVAGDDTPVRGFLAKGLTPLTPSIRDGDAFSVRGLKPGEKRQVYFQTLDQRWAAVKEFSLPSDGEPKPETVRLSACGTIAGRLADSDGKPLSEWLLTLTSSGSAAAITNGNLPSEYLSLTDKPVRTDTDGYFRFKGVPANVAMEVLATPDPGEGDGRNQQLVKSVRIRPEQNLDLEIVSISVHEAN